MVVELLMPLFLLALILVILFGTIAIRERNIHLRQSNEISLLKAENNLLTDQKNTQFELLKKSILETSKISQRKDDVLFQHQCKLLTKSICEIFNVEYCAIGMIEKGMARDYAAEVIYDTTEDVLKTLNDTREIAVLDTVVGRALRSTDNLDWYWSYDEMNRDFSDDDALELFGIQSSTLNQYRKYVLRSGAFYNILFAGLYRAGDPADPIGYITLVNHWESGKSSKEKGFTLEERETVRLLADNISILLENQEFQKAGNQDEHTINEWYSIDNVDELLNEILKYLNREFDSLIASYWTLADNGFEEQEQIVALRAYQIASDAPSWYKDYVESHRESPILDSLSGKIISNNFGNRDAMQQDSIRFVNRLTDGVRIVWEKIESPYVIGIPVMKSLSKDREFAVKDRVWGVICLQPKGAVENQEDNSIRLKDFQKHVQILLEKAIFKRRFHQIEELNEKLVKLDLHLTEQEFYKRVTKIVADTSDTEACSIFLASPNQDYLYLKATSSDSAINQLSKKAILLQEYLEEQKPIYSINPSPDSITARVFKLERSVLVYDLDKCNYAKKVFVERTESTHKSIIAMPLFNGLNEAIGVIRCINKKKQGNILHTFVKGDIDLLEIITGIISGYLIYKEYDEQRNKALAHFGHENRSPIAGLQYCLDLLDYYLNEKQNFLQASKKLRQCMHEVMVIKHNTNNTESILLGKDEDSVKYEFKMCNLHEISKKISDLFDGKNTIVSNTSKAPMLYVDESRMYQVFYNMLFNAVRYSNRGAKIEVFYEKDSHYPYWHKFKFVNEGIGIEEGEEDKIFDIPNYRSHKAKVIEPSGSGYGLKVCKKIIEKHGGKIKVTHLNYPTEFTVFLPENLEKKKI